MLSTKAVDNFVDEMAITRKNVQNPGIVINLAKI